MNIMATKGKSHIHFLSFSCCFMFISLSYSLPDTLQQGQQLRDYDHLVSADGTFKLGFFSPGSSRSRYLGISYNVDDDNPVFIAKKKVVWVANRDNPIPDASGILAIDKYGKLRISYGGGSIALSSVEAASNVSATLLDSGNFVLKEMNSDGSIKQILWQSFDYPTDTLLPGMKLGIDDKNARVWLLTSWINDNIPAKGSFTLTLGIGVNGDIQLVTWWKGSIYWTSGTWQNEHFEFVPQLSNEGYNFSFFSHDDEYYFTYSLSSKSRSHNLSRYMLDSSGSLLEISGTAPFGSCSYKSDRGCVAINKPECRRQNEQFEERKGVISGERLKFDQSYNMSHFDCQEKCLSNCSCSAYAYTIANETVCEIWSQGMVFKEKKDERRVIYVLTQKKAKRWIWPVIAVAGIAAVLVACSGCYFMTIRNKIAAENEAEQEILLSELEANSTGSNKSTRLNEVKKGKRKSHELHFFSFESIVSATDNFATANKLGEGGFGPVYKGELQDGQKVAVKRLSRHSGQGLKEFKNEIVLIAKLQHTNLVRLVGCCIQREEKMLIYEFMLHKSLDFFLFDSTKKNSLDWRKRFHIIEGIAQGLLYLHKYSRLRIIHRDLKASNILLDAEMNPKISDFGLARIFGGNESEARTRRVVGTHGYMAPEYALKGIVSTKIDVFSFGVLLLEIVSSKKNNSIFGSESSNSPFNLIELAWELWSQGKGLELKDPTLGEEACPQTEVIKCIHIGLLCVQDQATERPNMSDIVTMLTNETSNLPSPKQPIYFVDRFHKEQPKINSKNCSINNVSITAMEAR